MDFDSWLVAVLWQWNSKMLVYETLSAFKGALLFTDETYTYPPKYLFSI